MSARKGTPRDEAGTIPGRQIRLIPGAPEIAAIPLGGWRGKDKFALIDSQFANHPLIVEASWCVNCRWYVRSGKSRRMNLLLHQAVMEAAGIDPPTPKHTHIDHRNGNLLDNRLESIRWATNAQNSRNSNKVSGISGLKGVAWISVRGKWLASIRCDYKRHRLGLFDDKYEAALAYDAKARELFGEFALTNADLGLLPAQSAAGGEA